MRVRSFQLTGIRNFEDTGLIELSPRCNVFVGQNNAGKSTLLKAILVAQEGFSFDNDDARLHAPNVFSRVVVDDIQPTDQTLWRPNTGHDLTVEIVPRTPAAHIEILRELGYEFVDSGLFDAWLFLEESSAERIINDVLVPRFTPRLGGRLRTFAANGITNVEPRVTEFQKLVTFVHLEPVYQNRLWVKADGDGPGTLATEQLRGKFPYLDKFHCDVFSEENFELYYPEHFAEKVKVVLAIPDKALKRSAKAELLQDVITWTKDHSQNDVSTAWSKSAGEVISYLAEIDRALE